MWVIAIDVYHCRNKNGNLNLKNILDIGNGSDHADPLKGSSAVLRLLQWSDTNKQTPQ